MHIILQVDQDADRIKLVSLMNASGVLSPEVANKLSSYYDSLYPPAAITYCLQFDHAVR